MNGSLPAHDFECPKKKIQLKKLMEHIKILN
jgi:hypothetical protein